MKIQDVKTGDLIRMRWGDDIDYDGSIIALILKDPKYKYFDSTLIGNEEEVRVKFLCLKKEKDYVGSNRKEGAIYEWEFSVNSSKETLRWEFEKLA